MINRTLSVASVAILSSLTFTAFNFANAADSCRASPGTETPSGGHWRYRLEKGTGNKCWYLAGVTNSSDVAQATPSEAPKPQTTAPKLKSSEMEPAVADARAELTTTESAQLNASVWPQMQSSANAESSAQTAIEPPHQNTALAQRWPEPNSVRTSDDEFAEKMRVAANTSAQPAPAAAPAPIAPSQDDSALSPMRILLVATIGTLALVGFLLRSILTYVSKRKKRNAPRRPIWDDLAIDGEQMPPYVPRSAPMQPAQYEGTPRQRYAHRDDEEAREEIEYLLRRAAHRERR